MKALAPKPRISAKVEVGWPKLFRAERVGLSYIDMVESGHLNIPLEKLPGFLKAKGYPQIAWAVEEQCKNRQLYMKLDKDDSLGKRMLIKELINGR